MSADASARGTAIDRLAALPDRGKAPVSARVLETWVAQAQPRVGVDAGRLGCLIASTVAIAALQRAVDDAGRSRFLLKGGTYLQHRLHWSGRPTRDVDGLVRGDIDDFLDALDDALRLPWGPMTLTRTAVEVISTPTRVIKPRRFSVKVALKGQVWRNVQVEIAADEAGAADDHDVLEPPVLDHFGLPTPPAAARHHLALPDRPETARVLGSP